MTENDYLLFRALVLLGILDSHHSVFVGAIIQKSPGPIPDIGALLAHFNILASEKHKGDAILQKRTAQIIL